MKQVARILIALLIPSLSTASCIPFDQARNHLDETQCITGKVIRVQEGDEGAQYLDFCEDYRLCPFTVVVFPYDLKKNGDVPQLAGKVVEIRGEVKEYDEPRRDRSGKFQAAKQWAHAAFTFAEKL